MLFYKLFTVVIIAIIIAIIIIYHIHSNTIIINQTTINKFDFHLLYQKNPLIISDHIIDLSIILESWFKYNFISTQLSSIVNTWKQNNAKYCLLHNNNNFNIDIHICTPNTKLENNIPISKTKIVTITLSSHQFIVLPYNWFYYNLNYINVFNINDFYTKFVSIL
tara:strand:+ start:196 stop:690 length:495 start_codon:yes stop_codon:yes gene_type:complete